jgi:hypothetical protein
MSVSILRRVLLIHKPFQYSIIGWFFFFSLLLIAIFYGSIWYFFNHLTAEAVAVGLPPGHVFFRFVADQKAMMNKIFLFSCLLSFVTISFGGLYLSNKVAGPLYRLIQHMLKYSIHDVKPVYFRKGDYFIELQDAFNDFVRRSK